MTIQNLKAEYALSLLSFGAAVALTSLLPAGPSASLFCCLTAVAIVARYCSLRPRLLAAGLAGIFVTWHLTAAGVLAGASAYRTLFALYIVISGLLCLDGGRQLPAGRIPNNTVGLPAPVLSPEEARDNTLRMFAEVEGRVSLPRADLYDWTRQCVHFRDLIWNIDDCWRRRDWKMLSHSISLAYRQVNFTEQMLLQSGLRALEDPAHPTPGAGMDPHIVAATQFAITDLQANPDPEAAHSRRVPHDTLATTQS